MYLFIFFVEGFCLGQVRLHYTFADTNEVNNLFSFYETARPAVQTYHRPPIENVERIMKCSKCCKLMIICSKQFSNEILVEHDFPIVVQYSFFLFTFLFMFNFPTSVELRICTTTHGLHLHLMSHYPVFH